jgi:hypothetical protein
LSGYNLDFGDFCWYGSLNSKFPTFQNIRQLNILGAHPLTSIKVKVIISPIFRDCMMRSRDGSRFSGEKRV